MDDAALAQRLRQVEDRLAIQELISRYCIAMDDSDWDGLAELFTRNADFAGAVGREKVVENLRRGRSRFGRTIHTPHPPVLTFVDDDHATGVLSSHAELDVAGTSIVTAMRYLDTYEREDGMWRFAKRRIRYQYAVPADQLPIALTDPRPVRWPGAEPKPADPM